MVVGIFLAVLLFGTLFFIMKNKPKNNNIKVDKNYISLESPLTKFEDEMLFELDKYRDSLGINNLMKTDNDARNECYSHIRYTIGEGKISHDNFPDRQMKMRINGATKVGEVIAFGFSTPKGMVNGFKNSPKHNEIISDNTYTHVGIRAMKDENGRYHGMMLFLKF